MLCFDPYTIPNLSRGVEQNYYCNQKQRGMVNEGTIFYRCPCSPKYFSGYNLVVHKMEPVETRKLAMRSIQVKKEGDPKLSQFLLRQFLCLLCLKQMRRNEEKQRSCWPTYLWMMLHYNVLSQGQKGWNATWVERLTWQRDSTRNWQC